jgi:transposase
VTLTHAQRRVRRAEIAQLVADGLPIADAANQFGVSIETVRRACQEHGVAHRNVRIQASSMRVLAELLNTRSSTDEIGDRLGFSRQWVQHILRAAREAGIRFPLRDRAARRRA